MKKIPSFGIFLAANAFAAALQAQSEPSAVRVRDSASVRIIETAISSEILSISTKRIADVGGLQSSEIAELDAAHPFLTARLLSDGRIVVADFQSLKFYQPDGRLIKVAGRRGAGPGEFRQLRELCVLAGDSLLAIGLHPI